jgi:hypothetical protein
MFSVTSSSNILVARQGLQKADENCTKVARDPKAAPIMLCVIKPLSDLTTTLPRER